MKTRARRAVTHKLCCTGPVANLTLSIDDEILKRARIRALELDTSVNALVREYLTALVSDEREVAQSGLLRLIDGSKAGGEASARSWSRAGLYEERTQWERSWIRT